MNPTPEQIKEWLCTVADAPVGTAEGDIMLATLAYQAGHAAALAELQDGGVELPSLRTHPEPHTYTWTEIERDWIREQLLDYGDRRAAAQAAIQKINYAPLYEYAQTNNVSYNQLCAVVADAVGVGDRRAAAMAPPGYKLVPVDTMMTIKHRVNTLATLSLKAERYSVAIDIKQMIADLLEAAPKEPT